MSVRELPSYGEVRNLKPVFKFTRKVFNGGMIRSTLPDRIIQIINRFRKYLKSIILLLVLFLEDILLSYFPVVLVATFILQSYSILLLLPLAVIQKNLLDFPSGEIGAESNIEFTIEKEIGVALYLRVSTDRQAERGFSLQDQEERLVKEAEEKWPHARKYKIADPGESGTDFTRKGLNKILELAREGKIQYVLVTSLDRIGRDLIESLDYVRKLREFGVKIIAAGAETDISTEEGLMIAAIQFLSSELENKRRTKSSIAGRIQSFRSKHWSRPRAPIGYQKNENGWIEKEPSWEPLIKRAYDLYAKRSNYQVVKNIVNKEFQSFLTKPLTHQQVRQILHDSVYIGRPQYAGKVTNEDPSLTYVVPEVFEKVQKLASLVHRRHSRKHRDLFQDLVKEYGLGILEFIPNIAVICPDPDCKGVMVKNGTVSIGEWTVHNYLCKKCGTQSKIPSKRQMKKIQEWATKQREGLNTNIGK